MFCRVGRKVDDHSPEKGCSIPEIEREEISNGVPFEAEPIRGFVAVGLDGLGFSIVDRRRFKPTGG